jgi:hypothetical protein
LYQLRVVNFELPIYLWQAYSEKPHFKQGRIFQKKLTMETLELYPFESAEMQLTQATIIPPIYYVEVTGKTRSLNPVIKLENTGKIAIV